ncbi:MAG: hypothetical protein M1838_000550 [Thelocarpon superellum]|nr:MAG: hypothetical protein M1838_000550 [Thelocarpon superellum]
MDDMLRSIRHFKPLASSIETVYLVEASPSLRESQRKLLCGDRPMEETPHGFRSRSKYSGIPIIWCEDIRFVPSQPGRSPFIVAHEFFDALPIHAFQSVAPSNTHGTVQGPGPVPRPSREAQWRELVVSPAPVASSTTARIAAPGTGSAQTDPAEFVLSVAKASTPNSLVLPDRSPRYQALRHTAGATIEVCPEGQSYAEEFARRIGGAPGDAERGSSPSGAALILDYGPASTIPVSSLRGIRSHHHVSPFSSPGLVDLSADVDFAALAEAALRASPAVEVHGPVEQGGFLQAMGITERAEQLSSHLGAHEVDARTRIESGWMRLVDRGIDGMGKLYKAMAIIPVTGGVRRPVGFGGDIAE